MKLKKIDTESKAYKNIRGGISWFSGLGAGFTLEAMSIPWVKSVVNSKLMRLSCFGGIVTMSTFVMEIGRNYSAEVVDAFADVWNGGVDFLNELHDAEIDDNEPDDFEVETKQTFAGLDIPGKNATPIEEKQFIADLIDKVRPFEFKTEDDAKKFVEHLAWYIDTLGHVDIAYAFTVSGYKLPIEIYNIGVKFGWTAEDTRDWGVDKISDDSYIADIFDYHDISDIYQILDLKEE
jgi:hypothetical protein